MTAPSFLTHDFVGLLCNHYVHNSLPHYRERGGFTFRMVNFSMGGPILRG